MKPEIEDGMGFSGLVSTKAEREQDRRDQADRQRLRIYHEALQQIASGEGYYGAQAREYKEIAKAALAAATTLRKPVSGLDCGVNIRTGKGECVCGRCSPQSTSASVTETK